MTLLMDIAWAHLRARVRQTLVSLAGVTMGVGFFIAVAALLEGSQQDFIDTIVDVSPHIVIEDEVRQRPRQAVEQANPGGAVDVRGRKPKDERRGIRRARSRLAAIDAMPGITAAPTLRSPVVVRFRGTDASASLLGIEPARERRVSRIEADMRTGRLDDLFTVANGVILGSMLSDRLGAEQGDSVLVSSPAGSVMVMRVVGIFHTGVVALDEGQAYALLKRVQVLTERPNVINEIRLRLDDVTQARALARRLELSIGYRSESWDEANQGLLEVLVIRNIIMYSVVGAILVVAGFGIFNIISTVTHEKSRDIAILKSLGFTRSDVQAIFVLQGLIVGATGTALGWAFGWGLCRILASIRFELRTLTEAKGFVLYEGLVLYAVSGAAAIGSAALAAYLPARRASRLQPVDIVRGAA